MVVVPGLTPVATPLELVALLMTAKVVFEDFQVTKRVRSWVVTVVPSEKVPVAVNCWLVLVAIVTVVAGGMGGVIVMDCRAAVVTVSVSSAETVVPNAALMTVVPAPTPVASPFWFPALLMLATEGTVEIQVTN